MNSATGLAGQESTSPQTLSRRAGAFYAAALFTAGFSYFARDGLIDVQNVEVTAQTIRASEALFRFAMLGDVVMMAFYFLAAMTLYRLFRSVRQPPAMLMAGLVLAGLPVMLINIFSHALALELLHGPAYLNGFSAEQINGLAFLFIAIVEGGGFLINALIGPWLIPLGYLVYVSGYFPKALGVLVVLAGVIYLAALCTSLLSASYLEVFTPAVFLVPGIIEIVFALWLLIKGAARTAVGR